MVTRNSPGKKPTPLVAATISAFVPGAGQSRQGRRKMAAIMYAVLFLALVYFSYELITTYMGVFNREIEAAGDPLYISMEDVWRAVGAAVVACVKNPRIITVFLLLPCIHVWSMIDAYLAGSKQQ